MMVVVIIGILAALASVAFTKVRMNAQASAAASDIRTFAGAYEMFAMYEGYWPDDGFPGTIPTGMSEFLKPGQWTAGPGIGDKNEVSYDWDCEQSWAWACVSIYDPKGTAEEETLVRLDEILDDGNLSTGVFRKYQNGVMYVLEEF